MVYYRQKTIHGHQYWYLEESYREGDKVKTRHVAYIGKSKPTQTPIDAYKSKYGDKYLGRKQVMIEKITHGLSLDETERFYFENGKWIATDPGRQDRVEMFAEDIKTGKAIGKGIGTPIELFFDPETGEYELIDGAHRLAAYSHLGRKRVPAKVYKKKIV